LVSAVKKTTLYAERDEEKRTKHQAEITKYDADDVVYLDESGIDRFLHREYARSARGEQVICDVKGNKYQRVSMIAAQCGKAILAPFVFTGTTDANVFNAWLKEQLVPQLRAGQVIVMDNYCIHKTKENQQIIEEAGCKILFLPPYSPDLNPIENTWAIIKSRIRALQNTVTDFHQAINQAFQQDL
jgi:transposase